MKNKHGARNLLNHQTTATIILPFNANKLAQPNLENKVGAGTIILLDNEPAIVVHRIDMPILGPQDGAIEVSGESMAPTFPHGCKIGILRMTNPKILNNGTCYFIIDKNFQMSVRRVYLYERNYLRLVCDNTNFPPVDRNWEQITAIFRITSTIIKQ
jgi:phage repressor protein C with HTH and peptisase S24 domain